MSWGLRGKVKEIVLGLKERRTFTDKRPGEDISLRKFMAEKYKDNDGKPLTPNHLFADLGIDENRTSVHSLMEDEDNRYLAAEIIRQGVRRGMGLAAREEIAEMKARALASFGPITTEAAGGQRFVSPEVFLDPVSRGAVQGTYYPDLIMREIPVAQPQAIVPKIDLSDAVLANSYEAATIEEGTVSYSTKTVTLAKKTKMIKITDEAVKFSSLSLLQIFMEDFGKMMGHTINGMAVDTIINGEQSDLSEQAPVVGVASTVNGVTWYDLMRVAIQLGLVSQAGTQLLGSAQSTLDFVNLNEVKNKTFPGAPLLPVNFKGTLALPQDIYPSLKVAGGKVVINDPSSSIAQLTAQPLMVETERIASKQISGTLMSTYTGFVKIQRKASVVIDPTIVFSGFPSYMQPFNG